MEKWTGRVGVAGLVAVGWVVVGLGVSACSDDGTGVDSEALEPFLGTWFANEFEFRPVSTVIPVSVDLVQQGLAVTLQVEENGRFVIVQGVPGGADPGVERGRLEVDTRRARVTLVFDEGEPLEGSYFFEQDGRVLTLGLAGAEFDFNESGEPVPARARLVLAKEGFVPE